MNSSQMDLGELVIFQPVLQAYPTRHSWIITAHLWLGNLECHWKLFNRQLTRTQQLSQISRSISICPNTAVIHCWLIGTATTKDIHSIKNMEKPTYYHTDIAVQHPGTYCVNLEYYMVCHTG